MYMQSQWTANNSGTVWLAALELEQCCEIVLLLLKDNPPIEKR